MFTDCNMEGLTAPNLRVTLSFADYVAMVNERLGISFAPSNAYKL